MPTTTRKPKVDLKAEDQHHRRMFCPDRHRIAWDDAELPDSEKTRWNAGNTIEGGLCSGGDTWQMKRLRPGYDRRREGAQATWRLERLGKAGWDRSGSFSVRREAHYAPKAEPDRRLTETTVIDFNCSHGHFTMPSSMVIGREEARARQMASYPYEIRAIVDQMPAMTVLMEEAIENLTDEGWDFVTENRIRCPRCIEEEDALDAKLRELKALDAGEPEPSPKGWDVADTAAPDDPKQPWAQDPAKMAEARVNLDMRQLIPEADRKRGTCSGCGAAVETGDGHHHSDPWTIIFDGVNWQETSPPADVTAAHEQRGVSYEYDQEWGICKATYEGTEIASIENEQGEDGDQVVVSYGRMMERVQRFATMDLARTWIQQNAGDLADMEVADQL